MALSTAARDLRDQYVRLIMEAAQPLREANDPEVALEAIIEATQIVRAKFESELAELRQEEAE